jgi:predicted nucleic-acid-binding protein
MSSRLVDTNLVVRHLTQDHLKHAATAGRLFAACDRGELTLVVLSAVLAECVFVLESFYKKPREPVAQALITLISSPHIEIEGLAVHLDALNRYRRSKVHFVDCLIAAHASDARIPIATFDADFKKFADVQIALD